MSRYIIDADGKKWVPQGSTPPNDRTYFYMQPDFFWPPNAPKTYYPIRDSAVKLGGAPCVFPVNDDMVELTPAWQQFVATLMSLARYNKLWTPPRTQLNWLRGLNGVRLALLRGIEASYRTFGLLGDGELTVDERDIIEKCFSGTLGNTVAFCNGQGYPGRANWVTMQDLGLENPKFDKVRLCGTVSYTGFKTTNTKGQAVVEVDAFIWQDGPPQVFDRSILTDTRIFWATIIKNNKLTNNPLTYAVNRFPRLDGGSVPLPLIRRADKQPIQFLQWYMEEYTGVRRPIYWPPSESPWL